MVKGKFKRLLSIMLAGLMLLSGVPSTIFADTVDVSAGTNSGNTDTSFVASAEMLGGGLTVIIPDEVPLTYDSVNSQYSNDSSVIAKGYVEVGKHLEVSVPTNITYALEILNLITADGTITFGSSVNSNQVTEWSRDELKTKDDSDTLVGVTKPLSVVVPKANIMDIGTYSSVIDFYINLVDDNGDDTEEDVPDMMMYALGYDYVTTPTYIDNDNSIAYDEYYTSGDTVAELRAFRVVEANDGDIMTAINEIKAELAAEGYDYVTTSLSKDLTIPSTVESVTVVGVSFKEFFNDNLLSKYVTNITLPNTIEGIELAENTSSSATTVITSQNIRDSVNLSKFLPFDSLIKFIGEGNPDDGDDDIIIEPDDDDDIVDGGDDLEYEDPIYFTFETTDTEATITGLTYYGETTLTEINIPSTYNDLPVTTIGAEAFKGKNNIISVVIPNSVKTIENDAFSNCESLESITIPNSVRTIGSCVGYDSELGLNCNCNYCDSLNNGVFHGCYSLKSITIPDSVIFLGANTFSRCYALEEIVLSNQLSAIYQHTFSGCESLTNISIPSNVTYIGSGVFDGCTGLRNITIPNSITHIGDSVFANCTNITSIEYNSVKYTSSADLVYALHDANIMIYFNSYISPFDSTALEGVSNWSYTIEGIWGFDIESPNGYW